MKKIKRCFVPGRNDGILSAVALLILTSLTLPQAIYWDWMSIQNCRIPTLATFATLIGLLFGLAVIVGSPMAYRKTKIVIAIIGVALSALAFGWSASSVKIWESDWAADVLGVTFENKDVVDWRDRAAVLNAFGVFFAGAITVFALQWSLKYLKGRFGLGVDRKRGIALSFLILVVFMAVAQSMVNQFITFGSYNSAIISMPDTPFLVPLVFILGAAFPGVFCSHFPSTLGRFAAAIGSLGVFVAAAATQLISVYRTPHYKLIALGCFVLGVLLILTLVRPDRKQADQPQEADNSRGDNLNASNRRAANGDEIKTVATENSARIRKGKPISILFGVSPIVLVLVAVSVLSQFNFYSLINSSSNRWEKARLVRSYCGDPGTEFAIQHFSGRSANFKAIYIQFSENSRNDYLTRLPNSETLVQLTLNQLNESIRCNGISEWPTNRVILVDSQATPTQIQELVDSTTFISFKNTAIITPDGASWSPQSKKGWRIQSTEIGGVTKLLANVDDFSGIPSIEIYDTKFDVDDWVHLVRAAESTKIRLHECTLPENLFEHWDPTPNSCAQIMIAQASRQDHLIFRLSLATDVKTSFWHADKISIKDEDVYAVNICTCANVTPTAEWKNRVMEFISIERDCTQLLQNIAKQQKWIVAVDEQGNAESLFYFWPDHLLLDNLNAFPNLKRLAYNHDWVDLSLSYWGLNSNFQTTGLVGAPMLESLSFSGRCIPDDLKFLGKLNKLTSLQISADRMDFNSPGFEQCQSLRHLVLLGTPGVQVISEIAQLSNLKELEIVDTLRTYQSTNALQNLQKSLPQVEIKVVSQPEYQPKLPDEYRKYIRRLKDELLQKYFGPNRPSSPN